MALLSLVTAISCMPETIVAPSQRPSVTPPPPSSTPQASAAPTPTQSATHPPQATFATPTPAGTIDVRTRALGRLSGQWIFVGKEIATPTFMQREIQIFAVPLDGGSPVQAVTYPAGVPVVEALSDLTPYLRRQFSPDGTQLVLSVQGQLVVVDLSSGQVRRLGTAGFTPVWSKDGSQIAYVDLTATQTFMNLDWRVWVVPSGGGSARELPARAGSMPAPVEWSPDGTQLLVSSQDGTDVVDVRSGRVTRHLDEHAWAFGHWRNATPQIALPTVTSPGAPVASRLVALDNSTAPQRVLLESKQTFDAGGIASPTIWFSDPRWSPVANDILYVETHQSGGGPIAFETHVYEIASGHDTVIPVDAYQVTWTWDGRRIVYLTPHRAPFNNYGSSLRIANRDGSGSRELLGGGDDKTFFFNVASLNY